MASTIEAIARELGCATERITPANGIVGPNLKITLNASSEGKQLAELAKNIHTQLGGKIEFLPRTYGGTDAVW